MQIYCKISSPLDNFLVNLEIIGWSTFFVVSLRSYYYVTCRLQPMRSSDAQILFFGFYLVFKARTIGLYYTRGARVFVKSQFWEKLSKENYWGIKADRLNLLEQRSPRLQKQQLIIYLQRIGQVTKIFLTYFQSTNNNICGSGR